MARSNTIKIKQLLDAFLLGEYAFKNGLTRAAYTDAELSKMYNNRQIGETPNGEASTILIMKAWLNGWDTANITAIPKN
jgi:hypothetical protein